MRNPPDLAGRSGARASGVEDPAAESEEFWPTAFRKVYEPFERRAARLLQEPFETMQTPDLTALADRIEKTA